MSNKTYQTTLLIRGDSKNAVRSVQLTREELEKLTGAQRKSANASTQFAAAFGKANLAVDRASSAIQGLGGIIAGLGVATFFKTSIDNTIRQEQAIKQLETVIESTGGAAGRTSEQMQQFASSLQSVTTFGDEAIIEAQAMLATFTNIQGVNFDRTTESILDLSQAMGQDLKTSTIQLGKALNDPAANLGALSRAGIQFSADQKELIKSLSETGRQAEAQALILDELERQFGGSARAAKDTLGGALQSLGNAWGDLLEVEQGATGAMKASISELERLLTDPAFKQAAQDLAAGMFKLATFAAQFIQNTVGLFKFIGEEIAAFFHGPAFGDIPRIEDEIAKLEKRLGSMRGVTARNSEAAQDLRDRIAELNTMLELSRELETNRAQAQGRAAKATASAAESTQDLAAATADQNKALIDEAKAQKAAEDARKKAVKQREKEQKAIESATRRNEEYIEQLEFEVSLIGETEREQYILTAQRKLGSEATDELKSRTRELSGALYDNQHALRETADAGREATHQVDVFAESVKGAIERIDSEAASAWRSIFEFDKNAFSNFADGLKNAVIQLFAEIAHLRITQPILANLFRGLGINTAGTSLAQAMPGSAAPGIGVPGLPGGGSILQGARGLFSGGISGFGTSVLNGASGVYQGIGNLAYDVGLDSVGNAFTDKGIDLISNGTGSGLATVGLDLGGGLAGGYLGNKVFGETSGIGSSLGAIAGSALIPIPGVGAAIGSFLGAGVESLFGGKKPSDKRQRAQLDPVTGEVTFGGFTGKKFSQENQDAASTLARELGRIASAFGVTETVTAQVGGRTGLRYRIGGEGVGVQVGGNAFDDPSALLKSAIGDLADLSTQLSEPLKALVKGFEGTVDETLQFASAIVALSESLKKNPVDAAVQDFTAAQEAASTTLFAAYEKHIDYLGDLVSNYDQSTSSAIELGNALIAGQDAAYRLATSIQAISQSVQQTVADQTEFFRTSVMTPDELLRYKQSDLEFLFAGLEKETDPAKIQEKSARLLQLNREIFEAGPEDLRRANVQTYIDFAQRVGEVTQTTLDTAMAEVRTSMDRVNLSANQALTGAAKTIENAGDKMLEAARIIASGASPSALVYNEVAA